MANLCFNLSQYPGHLLRDDICETMRELYRDWDLMTREVETCRKDG